MQRTDGGSHRFFRLDTHVPPLSILIDTEENPLVRRKMCIMCQSQVSQGAKLSCTSMFFWTLLIGGLLMNTG